MKFSWTRVGYYRRFVQDFATKAEALTSLTRKGLQERVVWNDKAYESIILQRELSELVMLKNPDYSQTFQLQTDASDAGVGAIISQGGEDDQPIAFSASNC